MEQEPVRKNLHALTFLLAATFKSSKERLLETCHAEKYHALYKINKGQDYTTKLFGDTLTEMGGQRNITDKKD